MSAERILMNVQTTKPSFRLKAILAIVSALILGFCGVLAALAPKIYDTREREYSMSLTETAINTNATPLPSSSPAQTTMATISLPFEDNFDNGARKEWEVLTGEWTTVEGKYTNLENKGWIKIGDTSWTNYSVEVDVIRQYPGSARTGDFKIGVRDDQRKSNFPTFISNAINRCVWQLTSPNGGDNPLTNAELCPMEKKIHIKIEVNNNSYISFINGQTFQTFTKTEYPSGAVIIGIDCGGGCLAIDNFLVAKLN